MYNRNGMYTGPQATECYFSYVEWEVTIYMENSFIHDNIIISNENSNMDKSTKNLRIED